MQSSECKMLNELQLVSPAAPCPSF
jgi:hypothetical protein